MFYSAYNLGTILNSLLAPRDSKYGLVFMLSSPVIMLEIDSRERGRPVAFVAELTRGECWQWDMSSIIRDTLCTLHLFGLSPSCSTPAISG